MVRSIFWSYCLFLFLTTGCSYVDDAYLFPYAGAKLALYGVLSPQGVEVRLHHSQDPNNYVASDDFFFLLKDTVAQAAVWLLDETGMELSRIPYLSGGIYKLDTILSEGSGYRLRASHPQYPTAESQLVVVPKPLKIIEVQLKERDNSAYRFSVRVEDVSPSTDYYLLAASVQFRNEILEYSLGSYVDDTYLRQCRILTLRHLLFGDICFKDQFFDFEVTLEHRGRVFDRIRLEAGVISASFFNYVSASIQPSSDPELFFFQPNLLSSNVRGGYGMVDGRNMRVVYDE